jgi:GeoRSP system SPASM domain protein
MNLVELASPIRMYWDVGPDAKPSPDDCRRIAEEIVSNKILSLQITETGPKLGRSCLAILDALKGKTIALSVVLPAAAMDAAAIDILRASAVKAVFGRTDAVSELDLIAAAADKTGGRPAVGAAFSVERGNFGRLPDVLGFCVEHKIDHLLLPMQRLAARDDCFSISRDERKALAAALGARERPSRLRITIHDPFLWRAFFPELEFPNGGCQAANTMLYLSPEAEVYPCPTMPISLGNLLGMSLKEVIASDKKRKLRKEIMLTSSACVGCLESDQCRGGCRGRAYAQAKSLNARDAACE